jgi:hypothetical protein
MGNILAIKSRIVMPKHPMKTVGISLGPQILIVTDKANSKNKDRPANESGKIR